MVNGLTYHRGIFGDITFSEGPATPLHTMGTYLNILFNQISRKLKFQVPRSEINIGINLVYLNF